MKNLEAMRADLMRDLEKERARVDAVTNELDTIQTNFETKSKNTVVIETTLREIREERDELVKEKDDVTRQLGDLRTKLDAATKEKDNVSREAQRQQEELE
ncbi:unnamed protein product, partial [Anisakis simplex]|uniref:Myosin_tail_1 domain-containing protein n=1 Tax=Anisakis simplex TaxID=6269 RepID=A0A0M3JPL9_ANISI